MVLRPHEIPELARGEGITSRPLVGKWNAPRGHLTTGITTFVPGTAIEQHSHNVEETILILEGEAAVVIGEQRFDLESGDVTWVPAEVPHYFVNRGNGRLQIYWVYAGQTVTRTLSATGETIEHLSARDQRIGRPRPP